MEDKEMLYTNDVNKYYKHLLVEFGGEQFNGIASTTQKLEETVKKKETSETSSSIHLCRWKRP